MSLSLYKKLESGRSGATQLRTLIRVARALGADTQRQAAIIRLGRPDLSPMVALLEEEHSGERPLESLSGLANDLLEARSRREALQRAVQRLHSALQLEGVAFALLRGASGRMEMSFSTGTLPGRARSLVDDELAPCLQRGRLHAAEHEEFRTVYVPIHDRQRTVAVLGVAFGRDANLGARCALLLETAAAILEARFAQSSP